jgi:hypothetical protein
MCVQIYTIQTIGPVKSGWLPTTPTSRPSNILTGAMFRRSMNRYRCCDPRFSWWTRAMLRRRINRYPAPPLRTWPACTSVVPPRYVFGMESRLTVVSASLSTVAARPPEIRWCFLHRPDSCYWSNIRRWFGALVNCTVTAWVVHALAGADGGVINSALLRLFDRV